MKVAIVVPAYNEERLLGGTLSAIREAAQAFGRRGWEWEVVVCDNNSTDRTAEIAAAAGARVVFEPVNQISRARNTGAAHADADWLVFVDADSQPGVALFDEVAAAIASGRVAGGGSTLAFDRSPLLYRAGIAIWNALSRLMRWAAGSFVYCEAEAFRAAGGFSEDLYAVEEVDLSRRIKRIARERGLTFRIHHRHPLRTSGRKARLYRPGEFLRFGLRVLLTGGRALKDRKACFAWYDGRR